MKYTTTRKDGRQNLKDGEDIIITIDDKDYVARVIPGYEDYLATKCGNVISTMGQELKLLAPFPTDKKKNLYLRLTLYGKDEYLHYLIALTFLEASEVPCRKGGIRNQVNHIDKDPSNNKVANLEIVSPKENMAWNKVMKEADAELAELTKQAKKSEQSD